MAASPDADSALILSLLHENFPPFSILLPWIHGSSQHLQDPDWGEKLASTTPSSFALSFLNYVRGESEKVLVASVAQANESTFFVDAAASQAASNIKSQVTSDVIPQGTTKSQENLYDTNFPALGVAAPNAPPLKSTESRTRPRRRVNPTPMTNPVVDSAFVFAKVESCNPFQDPAAKKPMSRSATSLKVDMDALMRRCEKSQKSKHKTMVSGSANQAAFPCQDQRTAASKDTVRSPSLNEISQKTSIIAHRSFPKLKRFAIVHAKLINARMVPSLTGELQYLFQLLSLAQYSQQQSGKDFMEESLFREGDDCSLYACIVMEQLGRVLDSVGEALLSALIHHPAIVQHSSTLLLKMKGALAAHEVAALHSFKAYKVPSGQIASPQSATLSHPCRIRDVPGMPVSLPFQASRDSRNNYRSRELQKFYNNRELCRDHFYAIVRESASAQNSFGFAINASCSIQENVRSLMKLLMVENYPWFTELFLEQIIQAAMCGETDPVVTGLARQDPVKLQRLHDRLTLGHRNRPAGPQAPRNLCNMTSEMQDSKCAVRAPMSGFETLINVNGKPDVKSELDFMSFFPQSVRVYVWILEAADSYRLSMQMMWCVKAKICKLTEIPQHSRDAADIGSSLTQRVLTLKALASLLGFLCFFPGAGGLQFSDPLNQDCEWDMHSTDPPIDVEEMLRKAMISESMLLTLPWVLDFLRMIKADQHALSLPCYQKAFSALHDVYTYSILDPENDSFGVASLCMLASLDAFFELMDLPAWNINQSHKAASICRLVDDAGCVGDRKAASCGLDRMIGVVDAGYIQHCCPMLLDLRLLLMEGERKLQNPSSPHESKAVHVKSLRKITPVQHPRNSQLSDQVGFSSVEGTPAPADSYIKVKLQQKFFEQRPELRRLVDFIVDTVAVNAAHAASLRCVPPVLEEGLRKLEMAILNKLLIPSDLEYLNKEGEDLQKESQVEEAVENTIVCAIQEALGPAMEYAKKHAAERTSEALAALASPDEAPVVLGIAAGIAADAAGSAACKKTLANISCDVRKRVTEAVESWRRNIRSALKASTTDKKHQEQTMMTFGQSYTLRALDVGISIHDEKENIKIGHDFHLKREKFSKLMTPHKSGTWDVEGLTADFSADQVQSSHSESENVSIVNRALKCCAAVSECCTRDNMTDDQRLLVRVKIAAVCMSIEAILSLDRGGLPAGGFDAIVHSNVDGEHLTSSSDPEELRIDLCSESCSDNYAAEARFRIERGLVRRCVALALHMCFLSPLEAFGYKLDALGECTCASLSKSQLMDKLLFTVSIKPTENKCFPKRDLNEKLELVDEECVEPTLNTKLREHCGMKNRLGGLMLGLLSMWEGLVKCGICEVSFLISEFLAPWRWLQALHAETLNTSDSRLGAVKHGITNVLMHLINMAEAPHDVEKLVQMFFEKLFTQLGKSGKIKGKTNRQETNLRKLAVCICVELLYLHAVQGRPVDHPTREQDQHSQDFTCCEILAIFPLVEAYCKNNKDD